MLFVSTVLCQVMNLGKCMIFFHVLGAFPVQRSEWRWLQKGWCSCSPVKG